jgi:predicted dehydrogenase
MNEKEQKFLRIGIIGAGRIVGRVHLPLLSKMPYVALIGIFDPDEQQARTLAKQYALPHVCTSLAALFALHLDIVLVACPNHLHASMSIAALDANAHVLCEKPMATSFVEAQAMFEAAERNQHVLMVAFANRFRPDVLALAKFIQDGQLGTILSIRCGWLRQKGVPGIGTWFTHHSEAGGGVLIDLGSHLIDLVLWLTGRPQFKSSYALIDHQIDARAQTSWYLPPHAQYDGYCDVEVSASAFAVFDGPLDLFLEVSWNRALAQDMTYLHIYGSRGSARLETLFGLNIATRPLEQPLRLWIDNQAIICEETGFTNLLQPFQNQWEYFIRCIRDGQSLRSQLDDSLETVHIIEALYASAVKV